MTPTIPIRWNHLHFKIPDQWEVIVKDKRHLILEHQLKPIAELRWQPPGKHSRHLAGEKIARQLEPGGRLSKSVDMGGVVTDSLKNKFSIESFSLADSSSEDAILLLTCRSCATTLLIRIYSASLTTFTTSPVVLESLNCHPEPAEQACWQIQDFYFSLPDGFELERSSFRFGLTSLSFTSATAELRLCRLAPASQHLQRSSLATLFQSFSSAPPDQQTAAEPLTLHYHHAPTLAEYWWGRVRRKKLYQASSFVHFPHHDRILGYSINSRDPIETGVQTMLEESYGIIQEKEATTGSDP